MTFRLHRCFTAAVCLLIALAATFATAQTPTVSGVGITSSPASGDTYELAEIINVRVTFDRAVDVTGTPQLALTVGSTTRQMNLVSRSDLVNLWFRYVVQSSDGDSDGISIGANALTLNGGTISSQGGGTNAALGLGTHAIANSSNHKVDGSQETAPTVDFVGIVNNPVVGDTFELTEEIFVLVQFDRPVDVTGTPQLALTIGSETRQADFFHVFLTEMTFAYTVEASDNDSDGISIGASALTLNGGTIKIRGGTTNVTLGLGTNAIANSASHKVDGSQETAPAVSELRLFGVSWPQRLLGAGDLGLGEVIVVEVGFDRAVAVTGTPQLALTIGSTTRRASYYGRNGSRSLRFEYVVQSSDLDADGIGVGPSALSLNGGTIKIRGGTTDAALGLGSHAVSSSSIRVDGRMEIVPAVGGAWIVSSPVSGDTYELAERIAVHVYFYPAVEVVGTPRLALTVGAATRQANYSRTIRNRWLRFEYVVQSSDSDADGISIGANALTLNGGTIKIRGGAANTTLGLGTDAIANSANHKVDGSQQTAPAVTSVSIWSDPAVGDTFEAVESIFVLVRFDRPVEVTGTPQLALTIGATTRQADYFSGSGNAWLWFRYVVQSSDSDADGISIGASALTLNGGTIRYRGGTTNAALGLGSNAISNSANHKVNGSQQTAPTVSDVTFQNDPVSGDTFGLAEFVNVRVRFDRVVNVTGRPQLALTIGSTTRQAYYVSGSGRVWLQFHYQVQSSDSDSDGISIGASALTLNGGTIRHAGGTTNAALGLGSNAIANSGSHKVDGRSQTGPTVTGVWIVRPAGSDDTYELGETISVEVYFDRAVDVTGEPQLALSIGSARRQASPRDVTYFANPLLFDYVVQPSDRDPDGISIEPSALALNGGTISVQGGSASASLNLGGTAIVNQPNAKVDGSVEAVPTVNGVWIGGGPSSGDAFEFGEVIFGTVAFDRVVEVGGEPQLALTIGSTTRQASFFRQTRLGDIEFQYVVQASDVDADGLSAGAGALTLNGGTIRIRGGATNAALGLGTHAFVNLEGAKVNGSRETAPTVTLVRIVSNPAAGQYGAQADSSAPAHVPSVGGTALPRQRARASASFGEVLGGGIGNQLELRSAGRNDGPQGLHVGLNAHGGEEILVLVRFNRAVDVSGVPQLALKIGSATRQASYVEHLEEGYVARDPRSLYFRYVVQSSDRDPDGISIGANALSLNGGTITTRGRATNAALGLGDAAISDAWVHKVNVGGASRTPTQVRAEATATGLLVTWTAATDATSYKVQWRLAGQAWSSSRQEETSATRLAIDGLAPGSYEVRVVAVVDGQDGAASSAAAGEVAEPVNVAPRLAEELPNLELDVGETKAVDLDAAFEDPNDDRLRYSASSGDGAVSVRVASGEARIRGVRPGEATITVTATDPEGLSATATFNVAVGALLSLSGDAAVPEGGEIVLTAELSRALAEPLDVSWRIVSDSDSATLDAEADDYETAGAATIPAGETTASIEIAIVDDEDIEPARERFVVELDAPENPNVGLSRRTRATATIQEGVCDRTPAVRDELTRNWQGCHWPRPLDLVRVPALNLGGRGIDALRPNDLLGLGGLVRLDLRGNALAVLPAGLLSETPRLRTLDLSDNALDTLPDGLFAGLGDLREVSVEGNPGAPFDLAVELVRTDAEPWAPGPATVSARAAMGAPFAMAAPLVVAPAASEPAPPTVEVAAGETAGTSFAAASAAGAALALRAEAAPMPTAQCGGMPCFRGFETVPGATLTLFHRPPHALAAPTPEPLAGGDALRLPLDALIAAGDAPDGMAWQASSSDESLATTRIVGTDLVVEPEPAGEGSVEITLVATDALGLKATVRFEVQIEFHWPIGPTRGWRSIFGNTPDTSAEAL